jgi:hypothetical protein
MFSEIFRRYRFKSHPKAEQPLLDFAGPPAPVFFALHHKVGNTYFTQVLRDLTKETKYPDHCFNIYKASEVTREQLARLEKNSITRLRNFSYPELAIVPSGSRVIGTKRDPRTLIVSCTDYHMRGNEKWTQVPEDKYDGKSYCEYLQSAPTDEDRLIISMQNMAGDIIRRMESFCEHDDIHMVALEQLSHDASGKTCRRICEVMGLSAEDTETFYRLLVRHSLWSLRAQGRKAPRHSTSGVNPDVISRLTGRALAFYKSTFGDVHVRLGYT